LCEWVCVCVFLPTHIFRCALKNIIMIVWQIYIQISAWDNVHYWFFLNKFKTKELCDSAMSLCRSEHKSNWNHIHIRRLCLYAISKIRYHNVICRHYLAHYLHSTHTAAKFIDDILDRAFSILVARIMLSLFLGKIK
jgi:hypothetical protein